MFSNSNITGIVCRICGRKMRYKPPCCSDKRAWLLCSCGFKEKAENYDKVVSDDNTSGSTSGASV